MTLCEGISKQNNMNMITSESSPSRYLLVKTTRIQFCTAVYRHVINQRFCSSSQQVIIYIISAALSGPRGNTLTQNEKSILLSLRNGICFGVKLPAFTQFKKSGQCILDISFQRGEQGLFLPQGSLDLIFMKNMFLVSLLAAKITLCMSSLQNLTP